MSTEPLNQREFSRVLVDMEARVTCQGAAIPGSKIKSLSMKGMLWQSQAQLAPGAECEISIALAEQAIEIRLIAVVIRCQGEGIAFQFIKILGPDSFGHLKNLVMYNAEDVAQIEQELATHNGIKKRA